MPKVNISSDVFEKHIRRAYEQGATDAYMYRAGETNIEPISSQSYVHTYLEIQSELLSEGKEVVESSNNK